MRPDFTKMTVDELRELYAELANKTPEEVSLIKGKSAVVELLMPFYTQDVKQPSVKVESVFDQAEMETIESVHQEAAEIKPKRGSQEWQDYVLGLLTSDEAVYKDGKIYPKAAGLRRLVELLLGPIIKSGPVVTIPIELGKTNVATIVYEIHIHWLETNSTRVFSEIADAGNINTPEEYARHASATACSRAAGRAFRNALLLSVNTAEEVNSPVTNGPTDDIRILEDHSMITATQVMGINMTCSRIGVDIQQLLLHNGYEGKCLDELTKSDGHKLMAELNKYSSSGKDSLSIPDTIKIVNVEKGEK